jgi:hypothetical protein
MVGTGGMFMLGINRWQIFKMLAAIVCIAGLAWLGLALSHSRAAVENYNRDIARR